MLSLLRPCRSTPAAALAHRPLSRPSPGPEGLATQAGLALRGRRFPFRPPLAVLPAARLADRRTLAVHISRERGE
ncbi:hypothetical protein A33M_2933 [Rhodovulum sp. PH10]|nr:hypothetical protein A33M_2933 [Rhodovulum sp. PH10]